MQPLATFICKLYSIVDNTLLGILPLQSNDMAVLVSWFVLFLLGTVVQIFRETDRIPFPAESLRIGLYVLR